MCIIIDCFIVFYVLKIFFMFDEITHFSVYFYCVSEQSEFLYARITTEINVLAKIFVSPISQLR